MLRLLELKRFKCFERLKLPLSNLTVLSGTNAAGKSSVIHALALLCQTMRDYQNSDRIILNGNDVRLGTVFDVVDQVTGRDRFEVGLTDDEIRCNWEFAGDRRDMSVKLVRIEIDDERMIIGQRTWAASGFDYVDDIEFAGGEKSSVADELRYLLPNDELGVGAETLATEIRGIAYITAEREGPREMYPLIEDRTAVLRSSSRAVGTRGEYAVSALFHGRDERVADRLAIEGIANTLARQVEARLDEFFPGCRIAMSQVQNANAVVLGIRTSEQTGFLRPIHCGFGITQILPLIVAVLSASAQFTNPLITVENPESGRTLTGRLLAGSDSAYITGAARLATPLILIENPEVHLHPSGRALMGEFLAEAAHAGVQIIAETHSDHVLNGVRRAVKSGKAQADEVAIHFFQDRFQHESQVLSPMLDPSGNIDAWPEGFFDQFDKDLGYFAGWGE